MNQAPRNVAPSVLSLTLVGIQFVLIGGIALTGPLWPSGWGLRGMLAVGGVIGLRAIQVMGLRQVKVFPEVASQGSLIVLGPYRWVRHPMYTSVLLVTLAWVLGSPLSYRVMLWMGLIMTLMVKLRYEERLLMERFPEYEAYRRQTKRLIPFVW
ncbi:MAG: isoprenylcysteine carboxylmethyltransferase family protein [Nitrospirota bacterium]|nr:isoprenylcysteine carboxylmethyltransferase family protein [Nitrospirota bacterium]MDH4361884.1 isoprenylcysteine carboxylmethyltransferase family protein [Nitrospirota bacterium]MDH5574470.1 isoprenylcysteine carboxylmethyltransferase family protein [Nitrospirota bacterium]